MGLARMLATRKAADYYRKLHRAPAARHGRGHLAHPAMTEAGGADPRTLGSCSPPCVTTAASPPRPLRLLAALVLVGMLVLSTPVVVPLLRHGRLRAAVSHRGRPAAASYPSVGAVAPTLTPASATSLEDLCATRDRSGDDRGHVGGRRPPGPLPVPAGLLRPARARAAGRHRPAGQGPAARGLRPAQAAAVVGPRRRALLHLLGVHRARGDDPGGVRRAVRPRLRDPDHRPLGRAGLPRGLLRRSPSCCRWSRSR